MIDVQKTKLEGAVIISSKVFVDARGFFMETFNQKRYTEQGLSNTFVQDNHSSSAKGVLRGLHYQSPQWQGKLLRVVNGEIFDVAVDIRSDSPTYGQWVGVFMSAENKKQFYVPEGFAHGFCVLSETADVIYKCTTFYEPSQEKCIMWNDPDLGIEWPISNPLVSDKDATGQAFREITF